MGREDRGGHSSAEAIVSRLSTQNELFRAFVDEKDQLVRIMYTTQTARQLTRRFSNPLVMDCTYKTSKERLPLLHIVGVTSTNRNFTSALIWLRDETTEWYERGLRAFREIMGDLELEVIITDREQALAYAIKRVWDGNVAQILCYWHLSKNITANCKSGLTNDEFDRFKNDWTGLIVDAATENALNEGVQRL